MDEPTTGGGVASKEGSPKLPGTSRTTVAFADHFGLQSISNEHNHENRPQSSPFPRTTAPSIPRMSNQQTGIFEKNAATWGGNPPQYSHAGYIQPTTSAAIVKMKANAALREKDAKQYLKRHTTSPYSPASSSAGSRSAEMTNRINQNIASKPGSARIHPKFKSFPMVARDPPPPLSQTDSQLAQSIISRPFTAGPSYTTTKQSDITLIPYNFDLSGGLPKAPQLPVHTAPQSHSHPIGAHTAGFYTKFHHNNAKLQIKPVPQNNSIFQYGGYTNDQNIENKGIADEEDDVEYDSALDHEYGVNSRRGPSLVSDLFAMDIHLNVLVDDQTSPERCIVAFNSLIALIEDNKQSSITLYDKGAVSITLQVMQRITESIELQTRCCFLLQILAKDNRKYNFLVYLFFLRL